MTNITTLFWDVGGVLLSNGWDRTARRHAGKLFRLDWEEFQDRHELASPAFERGELDLREYLEQVVFYCQRDFTKQSFKKFMFAQSKPNHKSMALVRRLASSHQYFIGTLNNESLELNEYRIQKFKLKKYFSFFLSSCYLGVRKPEKAIYRLALQLTQTKPEETLFIDDRSLNIEAAQRAHINTIHFEDVDQCENELMKWGVTGKGRG